MTGSDDPWWRAVTLVITWLLTTALLVTSAAAAPATGDDPLTPEQRAWLADNSPIRVGWFAGSPPVSIWVDGELRGGYAVQLFDLMEVKVGVEFEHVLFPDIPAVVEALREGEIDIAGTHGDRPDLLEFAVATRPTAWERLVFVGAEEEVARGLEDLSSRTATTVQGSPLEQLLLERFPELEYVPTATLPEGLAAVDRGEIDLYLAPLAVVGAMLVQGEIDVAPVGERVDLIPIYSWGRPDNPATAIVQTARELVTEEELALIHVRWTGFDLGDPSRALPRWLVPTALSGLGAILLLMAFLLLLRSRVRRATTELRTVNAELESRVEERTTQLTSTAERLRDSNRALTRFAKATAHDLKNPLAAVSGLAEMVRTTPLPQEQHDQVLKSIETASKQALAKVNGMLAEAVQAGARLPAMSGAEFRLWLQEATAAERVAGAVEVNVDIPDASELDVDASVLQRVATNLLTNAFKYATGAAGTRVDVSLERDGDAWQLAVDDNGPGIPEPARERVFEHGYRLVDDGRGAGMGLAEVRDLLDQLGGVIRLEDSALGGCRFVADIPVRGADADPG